MSVTVGSKLSFIHSSYIYMYNASSSLLLLRGAPETARILCRNFTTKRHRQLQMKDYLAARAGFEAATLRTKGHEFTDEPPRPTNVKLQATKAIFSRWSMYVLKMQTGLANNRQFNLVALITAYNQVYCFTR